MTEELEASSLTRFVANFGEQRRGITAVVLPLGHPDAIARLMRDLVAFGYGMGSTEAYSGDQYSWYEKSEDAKVRLASHVDSLHETIARLTKELESSPVALPHPEPANG